MARADLVVTLVRAGASGDKAMLRSTVEAMVADERAKSHHAVADRLERALSTVSVSSSSLKNEATRTSGRDSILQLSPKITLDDLILPLPARAEANQIVEEHMRADVLRSHGYNPRHRILLSGPPGNGKTSFAEAIAEALALPFFVVRYDTLVGSYLGETNVRLKSLFDYVKTQPCVLFFDEFDSIGKERGDTHETGEIKRVVSFFLMQLDQLPSYTLTIAATNHAELLDRAVWRRFESRISLPAPSQSQVGSYIERLMLEWPISPTLSPIALAQELEVTSFSEALDFCQNVRRRHILGLGETSIESALMEELDLWRARVKPRPHHGRSD